MPSPSALLRAFLVALLSFAALLAAETPPPSRFPPAFFAPDPAIRDAGSAPEPLDLGTLVDASLLASGASRENLPRYVARIQSILGELRAEADRAGDPIAKGELVLEFLHRRVFKAYVEDATTIDGILDTGRYNCVSSAVFYLVAARSLGLSVAGVKTFDHAFALLRASDRDIDVETTNSRGFDPGTKKEFTDSFGRVTGFTYVPPTDHGKRATVGEKALVGLILSNRIALLERSGRYRDSLRLALDLDAFQADRDSRTVLLDRINNLEADLTRSRDYQAAEDFATAALGAIGPEPRLTELARVASYNRVAGLAEAGKWDEAIDRAAALLSLTVSGSAVPTKELGSLIEAAVQNQVSSLAQRGDFARARDVLEARRDLLDAGMAAKISRTIGEAEIATAVNKLPFREAVAAADRILASGSVDRRRWEEAIKVLFGNEANRVGRAGDWLAAARLAEEGAAKAPGDGSLARAARAFRRNFVVEAHNRFAALFNARNYEAARRTVEEALASAPEDGTLLDDLEAAKKAMGK